MPATNYIKEDTILDAEVVNKAYKPSHPGLFEVVYAEGSFNSQLVASKDYSKGEIICDIKGTTPGPKRYTSVQVSRDLHIELNSDRRTKHNTAGKKNEKNGRSTQRIPLI